MSLRPSPRNGGTQKSHNVCSNSKPSVWAIVNQRQHHQSGRDRPVIDFIPRNASVSASQSPMDSESSIVASVTDAIGIPQPPPLPTVATTTTTSASPSEEETTPATNDAAPDDSSPTDRDVVFPKDSTNTTTPQDATRKANILLLDLIRLHRLLWKVHDKPQPEKPEELEEVTKHILRTLRDGKPFELAGIYDVPRPFLKSTGRFFQETEGEDGGATSYELLDEPTATTLLNAMILQEFTTDTGDEEDNNMDESPYKDLKAWVLKQATSSVVSADLVPEGNDAMLLRCTDNNTQRQQQLQHSNHLYEHQQQYGNKVLFSLVSQLVTLQQAITIRQRVDAALHLMKGMDEAAATAAAVAANNPSVAIANTKDLTTTAQARFLIRKVQTHDQSISWDGTCCVLLWLVSWCSSWVMCVTGAPETVFLTYLVFSSSHGRRQCRRVLSHFRL